MDAGSGISSQERKVVAVYCISQEKRLLLAANLQLYNDDIPLPIRIFGHILLGRCGDHYEKPGIVKQHKEKHEKRKA